MTEDTEPAGDKVPPSQGDTPDDEGPGWMPAILAASALMGIFGFIFCAFSTWVLFQHRTDFAIRTLRQGYLPEIRQCHLDPETKAMVVKQVEALAADLERGKYENWQAAGAMQRLQRLPVTQWGELQAVEAFINSDAYSDQQPDADAQRGDARQQISRLRHAVEIGQVNSFDFEDLLQPVRREDPASRTGHSLAQPMTRESVDEVIQRARLLADRSEVPDQTFEDVRLGELVGKAIKLGVSDGSF